ncbi:hypothetical protein HW555_000826 [Spodoptera exigua]|uniref:CCHC-type domain-containing protein n=1 Tax=Spodoptera exigua TaxID=7107 RepID=A0A835GRW6_SPOEX|nr:hypothetical protein HW555_000826 [Spodoptera exigua]
MKIMERVSPDEKRCRSRGLQTPMPPRSPILPTMGVERDAKNSSGMRRSRSRMRHECGSQVRSRSRSLHRTQCAQRSHHSNRELSHQNLNMNRNSLENRPSRNREICDGYQQRSHSRSRRRNSRRSRSHARREVNRRSRSGTRKRNDENNELRERLFLLEQELKRQRSRNVISHDIADSHRRQFSPSRMMRSPLGSDTENPVSERPRVVEPAKFLEEFVKIFKGRDRESFPVLNNVLSDFDPLSREQTIEMWISKVDECAEIYNWNDRQTVHYALPKLVGHAKTWYQGLPTIRHSWKEWKVLLRESFPSTENYAELLTEMLNRRARPGDSLELYYFSKINLLNRCKIFGKQAVDCLIFGIEDKGIRLSAQAGKFNKPEETLEFFKTVKSHPREYSEGIRREGTSKDNKRFQSFTATSTNSEATKIIDKTFRNRPKGNAVCFNCKEVGHMSYQCRKPITKCSECNFLGHDSNICPKRSNNSNNGNVSSKNINDNKPKSVLEVSINDDSNDKYRVGIKINGVVIACQVDLGSQATLVRKADAHKIGLQWDTVQGPLLRGLGSIPYVPVGKTFVTIEIQDIREEQVEVLIVDDSLINIPVLLGHSFTERPNLRIIKTATDLRFEKVDVSGEVKLLLVTVDDFELDIGGLRAVTVGAKTNYSGSIYVGGSIRGKPDKEYYLLPGEYQMTNGVCRVLIQSLSSKKINFCKDALVSRARTTFSQDRLLDVLQINTELVNESHVNSIKMGERLTISINTSIHDVTKRSPTELLFGRKLGNPSQGILNNVSEEILISETNEPIEQIRSDASDRIKENQNKNKNRFDSHRKSPNKYKEGDLVRVVRAIVSGSGKSKKLESKCQGPYRIKKVLPNDSRHTAYTEVKSIRECGSD